MRCTRVSEGCAHCWHLSFAKRHTANDHFTEFQREGYAGKSPVLIEKELAAPLRLRKPSRIGVQLMGDLWHWYVGNSWRQQVFEATAKAPQHTYIFLTKRPELVDDFPVLPNHWLGTSIENQQTADERIRHLLACPAALRFVSLEPLLENIDLGRAHMLACPHGREGKHICDAVNWVIIGCETGPGRRPCKIEWVKSLIDQADDAGVAVFVKQLEIAGKVTSNPADWPEWARRREWPVV